MKDFMKKNPIMQRLNSFASYLLAAAASLYDPIVTDMAMYETLKRQFKERNS